MPSKWFYPTIVTQHGEVPKHIPWYGTDDDFTEINLVTTQKDLTTVSNDLIRNMRTKTYYLNLSRFELEDLPTPIVGIELFVNLQRQGRITDETVVLTYNGEKLSSNKANKDLDNIKTYGSSTDLWNIPETILPLITDSNFGLLLRYQSNINWPHRSPVLMEHVQIRFY
jgi:hypothetical protein